MDVDRAVAHHHVVAPYVGEDLFAGEYLLRFRIEQGQQVEFLAGKYDLFSVFDHQIAFFVYLNGSVCFRLRGFRAFEQGFDSTDEYFDPDRLGDVVVGSGIESGYLGIIFAAGSQKGDHGGGEFGMGPNLLTGLDAVHLGHHDIQ